MCESLKSTSFFSSQGVLCATLRFIWPAPGAKVPSLLRVKADLVDLTLLDFLLNFGLMVPRMFAGFRSLDFSVMYTTLDRVGAVKRAPICRSKALGSA